MRVTTLVLSASGLLCGSVSMVTAADSTLTDQNFRGEVCIGASCGTGDYTGTDVLRFIDSATNIYVTDTSSSVGDFPGNDWRFRFNDDFEFGENYFGIEDATAGLTVFRIDAGAQANALVIDSTDNIGIGTANPLAQVHVVDGNTPTIRLEQDGSDGEAPYAWQLSASDSGISIIDQFAGSVPVTVRPGAPNNALYVDSTGWVGVGKPGPGALLHVASGVGEAKVRVEDTSQDANPRTLLELVNAGRPEIVLANTATNGEWSFGAGNDFFLKVGTVGSSSGGKTKVFTVKGNGDAILAGELTTGGTTCGGGCDRVFTETYALPTIRDHAEAMFQLGHLPNVGPTVEGAPINVTDKLGRVLNELEHAHIYIAELEGEVARLRQGQADLAARLEALERD